MLEHLEVVLRRLACGNVEPPGSWCACLQDVDSQGHLPSCDIQLALVGRRDGPRPRPPNGRGPSPGPGRHAEVVAWLDRKG